MCFMDRIDIEELRRQIGTFERAPETASDAPVTDMFADDSEERRAVLSDCHKVLATKQVSEHDLRTKLAKKEHAPAEIDWAIEKCRAARLINDEVYAEQWVTSRLRRGHGARRIRQDLAKHGVRGPIVEELLAGARDEGALDDAALVAARKKFTRVDLSDRKQHERAMRHLLGRGFGADQALAALRTLRAEAAESDSSTAG